MGKVPGFASVIWGYNFACKIKIFYIELLKFLYKWLCFPQSYFTSKMGPMEDTQCCMSDDLSGDMLAPSWCNLVLTHIHAMISSYFLYITLQALA